MPAFECGGWLHVTVSESSPVVVVKLKHDTAHTPYFDIDMPSEIIDYVVKNDELPIVKVIQYFRSGLPLEPLNIRLNSDLAQYPQDVQRTEQEGTLFAQSYL